MANNVLLESSSTEWTTPKDLMETLFANWNFTLDPCATHKNHVCDKYYTMETDGMAQSWAGEMVFVNPPYSYKNINPRPENAYDQKYWVQKAFEECARDKNTGVVMLIPARTETAMFHDFLWGQSDLFFFRSRLKFGHPTKDDTTSATFPSVLAVMGKARAALGENDMYSLTTLGEYKGYWVCGY